MYDIAYFMPVSFEGKYRDRLVTFRRYGMLNRAGVKMKMYLIYGPEEAVPVEFAADKWPFEVEYVRSQFKWGGIKNYDFVRQLAPEKALEARWWYKIDDDSINDVAGTVRKLDADYDWAQPLYICGDFGGGLEPLFWNAIARSAHAARILQPNDRDKVILYHEHESSFMTAACFHKILGDSECQRMWEFICRPQNDNMHCWSDQLLGVAARFVRVHPSDCHFVTHHPNVANFSLFGGRFTHIHFVDQTQPIWPFFLDMIEKHNVAVG